MQLTIRENNNFVTFAAGPSTSNTQPVASTSRTMEAESETRKLHALRLSLLSAALDALPTLRTLPGVRAIPFVQVTTTLKQVHDGNGRPDERQFVVVRLVSHVF